MYELLKLIDFGQAKVQEGKRIVLATIIHTIGSSYRKTGTQMIIADDLSYEGALSGGCVEKEVLRQSQLVFTSKENIVFEYDGRYKLGCNGRIFILIEFLEKDILENLAPLIRHHHQMRKDFILNIHRNTQLNGGSTAFTFDGKTLNITPPSPQFEQEESIPVLPQYQLVIVGGEYDSVTLANIADQTGLQTFLVVKEMFIHRLAKNVKMAYIKPEALSSMIRFDEQTAIVLMTHSLSKDLSYLVEALKVPSAYLGILGPTSRRNIILNDLMNYDESLFMTNQEKIENIYGPIGLNIGAKTPEEISVSILSEVISVFNKKEVGSHRFQPSEK
jgi:xanthine dehydrogenase accessory factor